MSGMSQRIAATAKAPIASAVAIPASTRCFVVVCSARSAARSPQMITRSSKRSARSNSSARNAEPDDDRDDAGPRHARPRHHDPGAHDQDSRHDHCRPVHDVALLVADLALLELDEELRAIVPGRVLRGHAAELRASPPAGARHPPQPGGRESWAGGRSRARRQAARRSRGSSAPSRSARPATASSPRRPP